MRVDQWFYKQSKFVQILLLALPFLGWVMEILIRISIALRERTVFHYFIFTIFLLFGGFWLLGVIDLIIHLVNGHLLFSENHNSSDSDTEFYQS